MNLNIYIDDKLSEKLTEVAKTSDKSRNAIIEEAISMWLKVHEKSEWPDEVLAFKGFPDLPVLESHRDDFF